MNREIKIVKKEVTEKAMTKNYIDPYKKCTSIKAGRTDKRWSTKDLTFRSKHRFGENFPKGKLSLADRE